MMNTFCRLRASFWSRSLIVGWFVMRMGFEEVSAMSWSREGRSDLQVLGPGGRFETLY